MFQTGGPTLFELARQALSSTEKGYDLLAEKFDATPFRTPDALLDATVAQLRPLGPFARGLDACCGTGAGLFVHHALDIAHVVGLDCSQGMLQQAHRRNLAPGARYIRCDAFHPPFAPASFDLVTCFGALGHIEEHQEQPFVDAMARLLAPGGTFAFITSGPPSMRDAGYWVGHAFNAVMRVRNRLIKPAFVMYYLGFLWPHIEGKLQAAGFSTRAQVLALPAPYNRFVLVTGRLP